MATVQQVKKSAREFLKLADELNEKVSKYLNGSDKQDDVDAYNKVMERNRTFLQYYCEYWGEPMKEPELDYKLAESELKVNKS